MRFINESNIKRIEVNGTILADNNDIESVTIFNTSSNKGTITNNKGRFNIKVALNDIVEVSALQFKMVSVTITKDVIASKLLKIYLTEHINQLEAVLLSSGLSGNLVSDIKNTKKLPELKLDLGNMNALEFFDDKAFDTNILSYELNKITNKGGLYNGVNFATLLGLNKLFKRKKIKKTFNTQTQKDLLDIYSHKTISESFNIPLHNVELFIAYIETKGINSELYKNENEVRLIEFLVQQSKIFLKLKNEKH